jgi:hypothetical protein
MAAPRSSAKRRATSKANGAEAPNEALQPALIVPVKESPESRTYAIWRDMRYRLVDRRQHFNCFVADLGDVPVGRGLLCARKSSLRASSGGGTITKVRSSGFALTWYSRFSVSRLIGLPWT